MSNQSQLIGPWRRRLLIRLDDNNLIYRYRIIAFTPGVCSELFTIVGFVEGMPDIISET